MGIYLPISEEQEGGQGMYIEPLRQKGLLLYIYHCMVHWHSLRQL